MEGLLQPSGCVRTSLNEAYTDSAPPTRILISGMILSLDWMTMVPLPVQQLDMLGSYLMPVTFVRSILSGMLPQQPTAGTPAS